MTAIVTLYHTIFYQPLLNALVLLYLYVPGRDLGIAIIILTFFVRMLFYPLTAKALVAQQSLAVLQPKLKELQEKLKNNRDELNRKMFELFRQHKVNPFSPILPILAQLPLLFALFQLFRGGIQPDQIYSFVPHPEAVDPLFLGMLDLAASSKVVAVLAGLTQVLQGKLMPSFQPSPGTSQTTLTKNLQNYGFAALTGFILWDLPSALGLYWICNNLFSVWQQWHVSRKIHPVIRQGAPSHDEANP